MKIKDLPSDQKPREKAILYGVENISDGELLALIIGSGTKNKSALEIGNDLITSYQTLFMLSGETYHNLSKQKGLSTIMSLKLAACFEIGRRIIDTKELFKREINSSSDIYNLYRLIGLDSNEKAILLYLDNKARVIKERKIEGNYQDSVELTAKELINDVVLSNAKQLLIIHNHPNESLNPSSGDIFATEQIKDILRSVGASIYDHIIITNSDYYSFKDSGLLEKLTKNNKKL